MGIVAEIKVETSKAAGDVCEAHPNLERSHFCEKCELVVCAECALSDHRHSEHMSHLKSVEEVASHKTDEIIALLRDATEWTDTHKEYARDIDREKENGNSYLDHLVTEINTACDNQLELIRNKLATTVGNLVAEIETQRSSFNALMDDLLSTEAEAMSGVTKASERVEELLDVEPRELVSRCTDHPDIFSSLKTRMDQRPVPSRTEEIRVLETIKAIRFEVLPVPAYCILPLGRINNLVEKSIGAEAHGTKFSVTNKYATSGQVKFMAAHPSGSLIIGYRDDRMELLHPNGDHYKVPSRIPARDVAVLADGRVAALTRKNTVRVYEAEYKTLDHEVVLDLQEEDFISAIAADSNENILLIVPRQKFILFYNVSKRSTHQKVIQGCTIPRDILEMSVSSDGKITIVADNVMYRLTVESEEYECTALVPGEDNSFDLAGNRFVLSKERVESDALRLLLKKYDTKTGFCLASTFYQTEQCGSGFEPWGICTSETTFAALISWKKIAFFYLT
ncbi:uncharacterized protein [Diadema antillarum]|uniref:uncharacterized protein n=1 Tax=Diadema antillarum TaxID=105358 RepID=UPI003A87E0E5